MRGRLRIDDRARHLDLRLADGSQARREVVLGQELVRGGWLAPGAHLDRALAGDAPSFEWLHRDALGHDIPCEVRLVRLPSSGRRLIRGSITDITERKRGELLAAVGRGGKVRVT